MDCNNGDPANINYTDLSNYFVWNRTLNQQVSIVFKFYQQVNIRRISLYFWSQPSVAVAIPNLTLYWYNDDLITPSNSISFDVNPMITISGSERQQRRRNLDINNQGLLFQFLRIVMTITDGTYYVFLSEVLFCGKYITNLCHN